MAKHVEKQGPMIYFDTFEEAKEVLDKILYLIKARGSITIRDYYEILEADIEGVNDIILNYLVDAAILTELVWKPGYQIQLYKNIRGAETETLKNSFKHALRFRN